MTSTALKLAVLFATRYDRLRKAAISAAVRGGGNLYFFGQASDIQGNVYQEEAATTQAANAEPIGFLRNRSGAVNATSLTTARPILTLNASGIYSAFFDGTDDVLLTTTGTGNAGTFIVAARSTDTPAGTIRGAMGNGASSNADAGVTLRYSSTTATLAVIGNGVTRVTTNIASGVSNLVPTVSAMTWDGSLLRARLNGVEVGSTAQTINPTKADGVSIGRMTSLGLNFFRGDIWLAYSGPTALAAADLQALESFGALLAGASA